MTREVTPQDPKPVRGWWAPCSPGAKATLIVFLASTFALQSWFVYSDAPGAIRLEGAALDGRRIWHTHNCQSCHQLYGFGGFLGPDLTNAATRITDERLHSILSVGAGAMPAYHLALDERAALGAFFEAMARTGTGQARATKPAGGRGGIPIDAFVAAVAARIAATGADDVRAGFQALQSGGCLACHAPLQVSAMGAPDLSRAFMARGERGMAAILERGSPLGMPPAPLDADSRHAVVSFLRWLETQRAELVASLGVDETPASIDWSDVPWWDFQ